MSKDFVWREFSRLPSSAKSSSAHQGLNWLNSLSFSVISVACADILWLEVASDQKIGDRSCRSAKLFKTCRSAKLFETGDQWIMAWELTYRNSFIDVEEKCLERPRRARSLSPQASLIECPEEEQLRSYVLGLAQKVEDVEVSEANEDEGGLLVPEKPASTSPPSVGSAGHPEVCRRPCLHFTRGYCEEGSACNFCHIVHEKTAKLDKKQRSIIYDLNLKQRSGLVFPFVEQKIAELGGMAEHGQELLGFLHEARNNDDPLCFLPLWFFLVNELNECEEISKAPILDPCWCVEIYKKIHHIICNYTYIYISRRVHLRL